MNAAGAGRVSGEQVDHFGIGERGGHQQRAVAGGRVALETQQRGWLLCRQRGELRQLCQRLGQFQLAGIDARQPGMVVPAPGCGPGC